MKELNLKKTKEFLKIREIVNEIDPIGIIYGKDNEDEYDSEVEQIIKIIKNIDNEDIMAIKIHQIFIEMFDKDIASNKKPYIEIAKKLMEI